MSENELLKEAVLELLRIVKSQQEQLRILYMAHQLRGEELAADELRSPGEGSAAGKRLRPEEYDQRFAQAVASDETTQVLDDLIQRLGSAK